MFSVPKRAKQKRAFGALFVFFCLPSRLTGSARLIQGLDRYFSAVVIGSCVHKSRKPPYQNLFSFDIEHLVAALFS